MICDVAVVGGGPVGCHIADRLSRAGIDVHVFEEHNTIGEPVDCSGIIGTEAAEHLSLDASVRVGEIVSFLLVSPSGLEVRFEPASPLAIIVDRAAFDRSMAVSLHENGASVHLGTRVASIDLCNDRVELGIVKRFHGCRDTMGESEGVRGVVSAAVVVLASGPRYRWQKRLGMGEPRDLIRTAQAEVAVHGLDGVRVLLGSGVAPGSFAWQVPFHRNGQMFARIGVSSRGPAGPFLDEILKRLREQGVLSETKRTIRSWVIPVSPIPRSYADRVIAVGDAAGQTKPTTGGGLYYGLLCAEEAAVTILEAFASGDFSAKTLRRYESRWKTKIGRELRIGRYFRRLGERLTDRDLDDIVRLLKTDGILATVRKKASFDWHKDVISFALRHPQLGRIFLKTFFR